MLKDNAIRTLIKRYATDRQIPMKIVYLIEDKLTTHNRNYIKEVIEQATKLQNTRNKERVPPLKRLDYRIVKEVINNY